MLIDWFTVIAQIINFLVLVYLLKRFLYGPIIKAMDKRQEKIALRLKEARKKKEEAGQEAELFLQKNRKFDARHEEMLFQIKKEVEAAKAELIKEARSRVDADMDRWYGAIRKEKETFLQDIRKRVARHTCAIVGRAIKDLSNADLENRITSIFIERLQNIDKNEREALAQAVQHSTEGIKVNSSFEIPGESAKKIAQLLQNLTTDPVDVRFEILPELICGIEVKLHGRKISWNIADYLESFEESMRATIEASG
ncbi:MAG: F-type H+-transporting ATPase subunit b [Desulfobacteraceae bacterium Eth-SRB1]|nr:MAG: F-type H+-transporting ATPase subunit b [Desulfobacteraceae bacterium Eth-SRB1]